MPDLESYMTSLEKKQQSVEKMMGKLSGHQDASAKKSFDRMNTYISNCHVSFAPPTSLSWIDFRIHVIIYNNQSKRFCLDLLSHVMRLHASLDQLDAKMRDSYEKFAQYLTDLKLEHRDGSVSSMELDALLDLPIYIL